MMYQSRSSKIPAKIKLRHHGINHPKVTLTEKAEYYCKCKLIIAILLGALTYMIVLHRMISLQEITKEQMAGQVSPRDKSGSYSQVNHILQGRIATVEFPDESGGRTMNVSGPLPPCEEVGGNGMSQISVSIKGSKLYKHRNFYNSRWGNVLSPYWASHAMAELGGYEYEGKPFKTGSWMDYLPTTKVATLPPKPEWYNHACKCRKWTLFHKCIGWGYIRKTIFHDTRNALEAYAQTRPKTETQAYKFNSTDWLIYDRCCVFCWEMQGISNIHAYDAIPTKGSFTVYSLSPPNIDSGEGNGMCRSLHQLRDAYLKWRNPNLTIVHLPNSEMWVDWARLVYAPNLLIPSVGSSFALWASLASNRVIFAGYPMQGIHLDALPDTFHILSSPVMLGSTAREYFNMTDKLGIAMRKPGIRSRVLQWWMNDVSFDGLQGALDEVLEDLNISRVFLEPPQV